MTAGKNDSRFEMAAARHFVASNAGEADMKMLISVIVSDWSIKRVSVQQISSLNTAAAEGRWSRLNERIWRPA
jgi:hypothetical protein